MYAVKENRQVIVERMMDLGCDPHQVNKVKDPHNPFHPPGIYHSQGRRIKKNIKSRDLSLHVNR